MISQISAPRLKGHHFPRSIISYAVWVVRPWPTDKWHLDKVVILINGMRHWLWRAVDNNGEVLDILVQAPTCSALAAKR